MSFPQFEWLDFFVSIDFRKMSLGDEGKFHCGSFKFHLHQLRLSREASSATPVTYQKHTLRA